MVASSHGDRLLWGRVRRATGSNFVISNVVQCSHAAHSLVRWFSFTQHNSSEINPNWYMHPLSVPFCCWPVFFIVDGQLVHSPPEDIWIFSEFCLILKKSFCRDSCAGSVRLYVWFLWDKYSRIQLLIVCLLKVLRNHQLVFPSGISFYVPITKVWMVPFLCILTSIWWCHDF